TGARPASDRFRGQMTERGAMRRVGHKGADLIAPGNTRESFDAALAAGVDMIEFDVLRARDSGQLVLAHDHEDAEKRVPVTLAEGGAGGGLYVWTVDDLPRMRILEALGVTGVISNDPRLFASLTA